ncbi:MAG: UrcA family protein [Phenylobacterium sp.]
MNILKTIGGLRPAAMLAAVTLTVAGGAAAAPAQDGYRVRFGDLNTHTPYGARVLLHRIEFAADRVCGDSDPILDLGLRQRIRHCRLDAIERAVQQVDAPMLSALLHRSAEPLAFAGG